MRHESGLVERFQIERLSVRNFRSIRECDVELSPLTFLVGPNGSGKSNFVDAIFFVASALQHGAAKAVELCGGALSIIPASIELPANSSFEFRVSSSKGVGWTYALDLTLGENPAVITREECSVTGPAKRQESVSRPSDTAGDRLHLSRLGSAPAFAPLLRFFQGISTALVARTLLRSIFEEGWDWRREALPRSTRDQRDSTWRMLEGFCELGAPRLEMVHGYLRKIGARFDRIEVEDVPGGPRLRFVEKRPGGAELRLNPSQCSSGVMNAAGLLLELFASGGTLAILESPEGLLHRDAVPAIRESFVAASKMRQVLVTTVDAGVLKDARLPAGSIRTVTQDSLGTRIAAPNCENQIGASAV